MKWESNKSIYGSNTYTYYEEKKTICYITYLFRISITHSSYIFICIFVRIVFVAF